MDTTTRAERLASYIQANGGQMTRREIQRRRATGIRSADELTEILSAYSKRWPGTIRLTADGKRGTIVLAPDKRTNERTSGRTDSQPVMPTARPAAQPAQDEPTHRLSLNVPTGMFLELQQWAIDAAKATHRPRVGMQDAARAMIRACISDPLAKDYALSRLREDSSE